MARGVSLLLIVLIIGSACLALAVSSVWLGVGERELSQVWAGAGSAKRVAEGCMENALERLRIEPNYSGETLSGSGESCIISISKTGTPLTDANIAVLGIFGDYSKKIGATIKVVGEDFNIISWQEN